jgi:hypothetical protein
MKEEKEKGSEKMLKVFFEDEAMKQIFLKFFEDHGPSFEQYMEINYAQFVGGDSDPRVVVGKNSLGIEKFNKSKGSVLTTSGIIDYANLKEGAIYSTVDPAKGMGIFEKKSLVEKDRKIGVGGDLDIVFQKMVEIEKSSEGLDLAIEQAKVM